MKILNNYERCNCTYEPEWLEERRKWHPIEIRQEHGRLSHRQNGKEQ